MCKAAGFLLAVLIGLAATAAHATDLRVEGGGGGSGFRTDCSGDFVVGIYVKSGSWLDAIGLKCGTFNRQTGTFKRPAWNKAFHGGQGGRFQERVCPGERFVSGIRFGFTRHESKYYVEFVEMTCSPVGAGDVVRSCIETGQGCRSGHPPGGGVMEPFGARPVAQVCPAGEAAVGLHGRSGIYVDALGLICGPRPVVAAAAPAPAPVPAPPRTPVGKPNITAKHDTDIYDKVVDEPGAPRKVIGMMAGGARAWKLEWHAHRWCRLRLQGSSMVGWVAQDELIGCTP
jgi:hypothetical protein